MYRSYTLSPHLNERPQLLSRQTSRRLSDHLSKPLRLCGSHNLPLRFIRVDQ